VRTHRGRVSAFTLIIALAGCAPTSSGTETAASAEPSVSVEPSVAPVASASPSEAVEAFPIEAFADISEEPVPKRAAAKFRAILSALSGRAGMSATVMSADGTWSGTAGKADGVRDVRVDDQFGIASTTKALVAAQVMQMVEAGELGLDDPVAGHLPPDLDFDTNGATIRQLLGHRSGIPDYAETLLLEELGWDGEITAELLQRDPQRHWTPAELLEHVPADRTPAGVRFEYANTNFLLLGLVIEHVRGRPIVEVLRDGVLSIEGVERLIYQPDEVPTEPMAMPFGESTDVLEVGGGLLPSLMYVTGVRAGGAMASDAPSLARWWRAFCAGEIVSQASLTEMTTMHDGYGLGLYWRHPPGTVGHGGEGIGYVSLAGCLPASGVVVVVLSNQMIGGLVGLVAGSLVNAVLAD
jgi:D-alanyl-D-alanine carboxypeptidase